ncbi:PREDICTED: interleukin-4 [Ceratotherium simum simum]|uniref:Interleukin-4 n=1 Tax=Ceratotherium simum simum TaxID=73337 RepID=A0ABM1DIN7_CERSS|nr:PREDICTED: interleukin-4 [Ceratotherium simum simum]
MGLISQLIPALFCLLACTSNFIHGHKCNNNTLREIIKTLNNLTEGKTACMELIVADTFAGPKNTAEKEIFCTAATALRQLYKRHDKSLIQGCLHGLDRNLRGMATTTNCTVNEAKKSTLKDFLGRLKTIMQEKYSKCRS